MIPATKTELAYREYRADCEKAGLKPMTYTRFVLKFIKK